jgi:hypothetical protein
MNIKQALKKKNQLIKELSVLMHRIQQYNSVQEGSNRPYSTHDLLDEYYTSMNELVELKTKIHLANSSVYDKIFRLSELKNMVNKFKTLECTDGVADDYYGRRSETVIYKKSEVSVVVRDEMVKRLEQEIQNLQDELDEHNYKTNI